MDAAPALVVDDLGPDALRSAAHLSTARFGFGERDQLPPWLIDTVRRFGGIALGAFADARLIGCSFALPGYDGRPFLLSLGLAVERGFESLGVAERLKRAQAERARAAGYDTVRWTATSVASRALYVYLSKLGARLVRFHRDLYRDTLGARFPDEVELEWRLAGPAVAPAPGGAAELVEIPWDHRAVVGDGETAAWSTRVRAAMCGLLDGGYVGTEVVLDREARRSFVRFERGSAR